MPVRVPPTAVGVGCRGAAAAARTSTLCRPFPHGAWGLLAIPAIHTVTSVCFSQSESEEKVVTYDHIGPNVCMGDHKVM